MGQPLFIPGPLQVLVKPSETPAPWGRSLRQVLRFKRQFYQLIDEQLAGELRLEIAEW